MNEKWVREYFQTVDTLQPEQIAANFTDDAQFRFGNAEPLRGKAAIVDGLAQFFDTIKEMHHKPVKIWVDADSAVCEADVTYTRRDGSTIVLPAASILRFRDGKISDYRIDMDVAPVYEGEAAERQNSLKEQPPKYFAVLRRPPEMSEDDFRDHWKNRHAPLVAKIPGVVKYVQYHVRTQSRPDYKPQDDPINGIVELWFESAAAFKQAQSTAEFQAVVRDEHTFLGDTDHFNHSLVIEEVYEVIKTTEDKMSERQNNQSNNSALDVAQAAFDAFCGGFKDGDGSKFTDLMAEDVIFRTTVPREEWRGEQRGRERVSKLIEFEYHELNLRATLKQTGAPVVNGSKVAFEFTVEASANGTPYKNWNAMFFEVENGKISRWREYIGDIDVKAMTAVQ